MNIYLADLTHTTITISNDSFPLNVGMVGANIKKHYPDVDIEIFKYPDDLKTAINMKLPDVIGLSNYPWNFDLSRSFLKHIKSRDKNIITVMGGPNISYNTEEQEAFMLETGDELDFYILYEGETGFHHLIESALNNSLDIRKMKASENIGMLYLNNGKLAPYIPTERNNEPDNYPSPYLTGTLDKFFDDKLSPMIETHRGCPFKCSYCHEGHQSYNKVNKFSSDRIFDELDYISSKVGSTVRNIMIADPNFGMFERDTEIAKKISDIQKEYGYPETVFATTAKNRKDNLIDISKTLKDISMPIWMSVQSMTPDVLKNINRKNINLDDMIFVQRELVKQGATTKSELIIPLPGETLKSHIDSLVQLMKLKIDQIICYQLMLLQGSELKNDEATKKRFKFETRFRVLPRSFSDINGIGRSIEIEEIAVSTKDFSFDDYMKARLLHLLTSIFYNGKVFSGFFRFINENKVNLSDFIFTLLNKFTENSNLTPLINSFLSDTKRELFESEDRLRDYYSDDKNFNKLVSGEDGSNLLQKFTSLSYMKYSSDLIDVISGALLKVSPSDDAIKTKIDNITMYYQLSFNHFIDAERKSILTKGLFKYNVSEWINSGDSMEDFIFQSEKEITFYTPDEQYKTVESYFERYGRDEQALGKIFTRLWIFEILRKQKN